MANPRDYNITVRRGVFDGEVLFEARVRELPDVAEYAESGDEAYVLAIDTIETTALLFAESERSMPMPHVPAEDFSGRVTLRVPRSLHRALSEAADEEGVSLNQHMVNVLGYFCGYAYSEKTTAASGWRAAAIVRAPTTKPAQLRLVSSRELGRATA